MYRFSTYKRQYKANLKLALPVVMTQLGQILVQVADNVMVGRYGGDVYKRQGLYRPGAARRAVPAVG